MSRRRMSFLKIGRRFDEADFLHRVVVDYNGEFRNITTVAYREVAVGRYDALDVCSHYELDFELHRPIEVERGWLTLLQLKRCHAGFVSHG